MWKWIFFNSYAQFSIFYYLQLKRKSVRNGDQVCIFCSSYNYCYDVLFLLIGVNALLLTYSLTCMAANFLPSLFTFQVNINCRKCIIVVVLIFSQFKPIPVPKNLENAPALVLTQLRHWYVIKFPMNR